MKRLLAATTLGLALAAPAYSASYVIDPTHTFVTYEVGHFGTSTNRGRFDKKEGTVQFDRAAKTGKVEVVFDLKSVSTGVEMKLATNPRRSSRASSSAAVQTRTGVESVRRTSWRNSVL